MKQPTVEGGSQGTGDEAKQQVIEKGKEENAEQIPSEDAETRVQNVKVLNFWLCDKCFSLIVIWVLAQK